MEHRILLENFLSKDTAYTGATCNQIASGVFFLSVLLSWISIFAYVLCLFHPHQSTAKVVSQILE